MATKQPYNEYRILNVPTSGLTPGDRYYLYVGGGKYKTLIVSDGAQITQEAGQEFIECDTVAELRNLDARQIWAIQNGYYKGVTLSGYYDKGDTPASIQYYLSDTTESDDGGSVFEAGGIKLEHDFGGVINPLYYGAGQTNRLLQRYFRLPDNITARTNTIFEITKDFHILENIVIGRGCKIVLKGGSINSTNGSRFRSPDGSTDGHYEVDASESNKSVFTNVFQYGRLTDNWAKASPRTKTAWINVADYGIIGDGVTDVTERVQQFFNNNFMTGHDTVVYFPRGVYRITDEITVYNNNITIKGDTQGMDSPSDIAIGSSWTPTGGTVYRGGTVLLFVPEITTNNTEKQLFKEGNNAFRVNYSNISMLSDAIRSYITNDYANGPSTGPKHRRGLYLKYEESQNRRVSACWLPTSCLMENCNIQGFNGVGVYSHGMSAKIHNTKFQHCDVAIRGYNRTTGSTTSDTILDSCYITTCRVAVRGSFWWLCYNMWIDEMAEHAFLSETGALQLAFTGHINHIDYAAIKALNLSFCKIWGTFNRCGCYYAGYQYSEVPEIDKDKCCQIYVANNITNSKIDINNTYDTVGDGAITGGICIANNIRAWNLIDSQINIAGKSLSNIPIVLSGSESDNSLLTVFSNMTKYEDGVEKHLTWS